MAQSKSSNSNQGAGHTEYNFLQVSILVVESNPFVQRLLGEMLRALNFGLVKIESDPYVAFEYLKVNQVDLILADWAPGAEELQFLRMVRSEENSPVRTLPIIVVSAFTDPYYVAKARDLGMTEYLALPLSVKTLYAHFCSVVERPRPFIKTQSFFGPDRRRKHLPYGGKERRKKGPEATDGADAEEEGGTDAE